MQNGCTKKNWGWNPRILRRMYNMIVRAKITYGAEVWAKNTKQITDRKIFVFEKLQRTAYQKSYADESNSSNRGDDTSHTSPPLLEKTPKEIWKITKSHSKGVQNGCRKKLRMKPQHTSKGCTTSLSEPKTNMNQRLGWAKNTKLITSRKIFVFGKTCKD